MQHLENQNIERTAEKNGNSGQIKAILARGFAVLTVVLVQSVAPSTAVAQQFTNCTNDYPANTPRARVVFFQSRAVAELNAGESAATVIQLDEAISTSTSSKSR